MLMVIDFQTQFDWHLTDVPCCIYTDDKAITLETFTMWSIDCLCYPRICSNKCEVRFRKSMDDYPPPWGGPTWTLWTQPELCFGQVQRTSGAAEVVCDHALPLWASEWLFWGEKTQQLLVFPQEPGSCRVFFFGGGAEMPFWSPERPHTASVGLTKSLRPDLSSSQVGFGG